ncbi:unnamed protein product [Boreogadus saida]
MRSRPPWADAGTCHGMGRELNEIGKPGLGVFSVNQKVFLSYSVWWLRASGRMVSPPGLAASVYSGNPRLPRLLRGAMNIMGVRQHPRLQASAVFDETFMIPEAQIIISDPTHVLNPEYQLLPSGRLPVQAQPL